MLLQIPDTFKPIFDNFDENYKYRYLVYFTGRGGGGGKSTNIPLILLLLGLTRRLKILFAREVMNSIKDSTKSTLDRCIEDYKLPYTIYKDTITAENGTEIIFKGIREQNSRTNKSLDEINIVFIDEADSITQNSFELFAPSIRAENSFIIMAGNPTYPSDFMYLRFGKNAPRIKDCYYEYRDYRYNPFDLPKVMEKMILEAKERDIDEYKRVWLGDLQEKGRYPVCPAFSDANILPFNGDKTDLILSCDFNINPNCWIVAVNKGRGCFHIIDEIITHNVYTGETIKEFWNRYDNLKRLTICGDASGKFRNSSSEFTNYALIHNECIKHIDENRIDYFIPKANGSISDRIQNFNDHILKNGKTRLFIDPKCKHLIYSLNYLEYIAGTGEINERPKSNNDNELAKPHIFDAVSYMTKILDPVEYETQDREGRYIEDLANSFRARMQW